MNSPYATRQFLLLLMIDALIAAPCCAAVIDIRSSVTASSGLVRLGDVADVDDADPKEQMQLEAVTLGPAPAPGKKLRFTQQAIRQRLLAHGVNLTEIEFTGQSVVMIESPGEAKATSAARTASSAPKPIPVKPFAIASHQRKKAEQTIHQAFHRHYKLSSSDIGSLNLVVEIPDHDLPTLVNVDADIVRFVEPGLTWGGPQTLTAQFPRSDGSTQVVRMQAWLNEAPQILAVKHTVRKGEILKESDLIHTPAKTGETGFEHPHAVVGQEAAKTLQPGSALQPGDTKRIPLVRSNDLITVKSRVPGLTVSRLFRATGSGAEGEIINCVALEDSRDKVQARVTGWHEAEIAAPGASSSPQESRADSRPTGESSPRRSPQRVFMPSVETGGPE